MTQYLIIPVNLLSPSLEQKLINSPITEFCLRCGLLVYKVEKSNVKIEIVLYVEFNLFLVSTTF